MARHVLLVRKIKQVKLLKLFSCHSHVSIDMSTYSCMYIHVRVHVACPCTRVGHEYGLTREAHNHKPQHPGPGA